jgi:hypothetical protein
LRLNRELIPGTTLQLDDSRAITPMASTDARRRCYAPEVPADGDPERAPQLLDAQPGHRPTVSLVLPNGRYYLVSRPGLVTTERKPRPRVKVRVRSARSDAPQGTDTAVLLLAQLGTVGAARESAAVASLRQRRCATFYGWRAHVVPLRRLRARV